MTAQAPPAPAPERRNGDAHAAPRPGRADRGRVRRRKAGPRDRENLRALAWHSPGLRARAPDPGRARSPGRRLRTIHHLLPAATGRRPAPEVRALLAEITGLGFPGTQRTFYRALERHGIRPHPCPDCHVARISGYALRPPGQVPRPFRLAAPLSPVGGETLASFLRRLADANRTTLDALLGILHPWFTIRNQWHDDRWQHDQLSPWADDAAARLAVISGSTTAAIKNALRPDRPRMETPDDEGFDVRQTRPARTSAMPMLRRHSEQDGWQLSTPAC